VTYQRLAGERRLIRSSVLVFTGNSTARLLGMLFSVAAARILVTADFGRLAFGLTVASIVGILAANAPRGLSRFLARHDADRGQQDIYFSNWLVVVTLTVGLSLLLLGPVYFLAGLNGWMTFAVGANLVGVSVLETYREAQRGLGQFRAMVVFYVVANLIQLLGILLAASLGWRFPALFLTIYGLSSLVPLVLMQRVRPIALSFLRAALAWRQIMSIGRFLRPLVFQTVFYSIWTGTDIVLLGRMVGPTVTGNYAAAKVLVTVLLLAPSAIGIVVGPQVARIGDQAIRQYVLAAMALTGAVTLPIAAILVGFKQPIILLLFGSKYPLASRPLTLLAVGMTLYCFFLVLENLWVGLGHPRIVAVASGLAMACTVSLGVILIPRTGVAGAAIAFAVGSAAQLLVIGSYTAWALRAQHLPDRIFLDS
jgi:O-antigen/teichoic acid export membrane protein